MTKEITPFGYDCKAKGVCFNEAYRLDFRHFADCFPRKISMTDIDGTVEIGGYVMMMEWKTGDAPLGKGQEIYFKNLTGQKLGNIAYAVWGVTSTMEVTYVQKFWNGRAGIRKKADYTTLKASIRGWVDWVEKGQKGP